MVVVKLEKSVLDSANFLIQKIMEMQRMSNVESVLGLQQCSPLVSPRHTSEASFHCLRGGSAGFSISFCRMMMLCCSVSAKAKDEREMDEREMR